LPAARSPTMTSYQPQRDVGGLDRPGQHGRVYYVGVKSCLGEQPGPPFAASPARLPDSPMSTLPGEQPLGFP